ncbi:MAG: ABC transporter substrate-binding protein [Egibacteraceae bacterium]
MSPQPKTLLISALVALALGACGSPAEGAESEDSAASAGFPMTVETCGREVTFEERPEKVMIAGTEAPSLLWAAGAADQVDVMSYTLEPAPLAVPDGTYADVPRIEPVDKEPSKEVIFGEDPDVILSYGLFSAPWQDLEAAGITEYVLQGQCDGTMQDGPVLDTEGSFEQIYRDIEFFGRLFGTQDTAASAVAELRDRVAAVEEQFKDAPSREVAVVAVYPDAVSVYGGGSIASAQIEALGLTNAFPEVEGIGGRYIEVSPEELIARNPDILILTGAHGSTAEAAITALQSVPGSQGLTALLENRIIKINNAQIIGGLQTVEGLELMAEGLKQITDSER